MDRQKLRYITWVFVGLTALIVTLMLSGNLRRTSFITLPDTTPPDDAQVDGTIEDGAMEIVNIRPDTVQAAIATLRRLDSYRRTVTVEQIWSGGSGTTEISTVVYGGWTRMDRSMADGQVRHTITDGEKTYIWYNNEQRYFSGPAGGISADTEQTIPTYEEVLQLPVESIANADYQAVSDVNCIHVETVQDEAGYQMRYWVSVDSGLLVAAEKAYQGEVVYRMAALSVDADAPATEDFTLPDGTILIEVA